MEANCDEVRKEGARPNNTQPAKSYIRTSIVLLSLGNAQCIRVYRA
jgi:hypothetical protein